MLDLIPVRNPKYPFKSRHVEEIKRPVPSPGSEGTISIIIPRFRGRLGRGFCKVIGIKPNVNVNLDAYGSFIWLSFDGKKTVCKIGVELKEEFGENVAPLYERLANFLSLLERNNLITYANLPLKSKEKHGSLESDHIKK